MLTRLSLKFVSVLIGSNCLSAKLVMGFHTLKMEAIFCFLPDDFVKQITGMLEVVDIMGHYNSPLLSFLSVQVFDRSGSDHQHLFFFAVTKL